MHHTCTCIYIQDFGHSRHKAPTLTTPNVTSPIRVNVHLNIDKFRLHRSIELRMPPCRTSMYTPATMILRMQEQVHETSGFPVCSLMYMYLPGVQQILRILNQTMYVSQSKRRRSSLIKRKKLPYIDRHISGARLRDLYLDCIYHGSATSLQPAADHKHSQHHKHTRPSHNIPMDVE